MPRSSPPPPAPHTNHSHPDRVPRKQTYVESAFPKGRKIKAIQGGKCGRRFLMAYPESTSPLRVAFHVSFPLPPNTLAGTNPVGRCFVPVDNFQPTQLVQDVARPQVFQKRKRPAWTFSFHLLRGIAKGSKKVDEYASTRSAFAKVIFLIFPLFPAFTQFQHPTHKYGLSVVGGLA